MRRRWQAPKLPTPGSNVIEQALQLSWLVLMATIRPRQYPGRTMSARLRKCCKEPHPTSLRRKRLRSATLPEVGEGFYRLAIFLTFAETKMTKLRKQPCYYRARCCWGCARRFGLQNPSPISGRVDASGHLCPRAAGWGYSVTSSASAKRRSVGLAWASADTSTCSLLTKCAINPAPARRPADRAARRAAPSRPAQDRNRQGMALRSGRGT